jgi:hypothetical protein
MIQNYKRCATFGQERSSQRLLNETLVGKSSLASPMKLTMPGGVVGSISGSESIRNSAPMALKTRPADLLAFKQFAQQRQNMLLCIETSFEDQGEAEDAIVRDFPSVECKLFIPQKKPLSV